MNSLIIWVCLSEILSIAAINYFPALLPNFQAEWGLTNTEAGWISGIYFGGYAASVPILASLTDRVDPRKIYLLSAGLGAVSLMGFGLVAQGTWTATAFRLLAGISFAGTYMPGVRVLSDRISGANQSRAISFYTASIGVGNALSVFLAGWLTGHFGWRWAAILMGLCPLAGVVLFAFAIRPQPPETVAQAVRTSFLDFRPALRNRSAIGYMLGYAAHCWELFGFRSWMVAFMFFSLSLQPQINPKPSPQSLVTLILLAGVPANILGNEGALHWGRRRFITIVMLISGLIGCLIGFAAGLTFIMVAGLCFAYWIAIISDSGSLNAGLVSAARAEEAGRTMALYSFVGLSMGFLAPLAVGTVLDISGGGITGWGLAFATLGLVAMSGTVWLKLFRSNTEKK
ncbi:MAG: MFS transporter [Desulfobacterales bacterium]|jgi:predicted MFS family arabinose efflux permease